MNPALPLPSCISQPVASQATAQARAAMHGCKAWRLPGTARHPLFALTSTPRRERRDSCGRWGTALCWRSSNPDTQAQWPSIVATRVRCAQVTVAFQVDSPLHFTTCTAHLVWQRRDGPLAQPQVLHIRWQLRCCVQADFFPVQHQLGERCQCSQAAFNAHCAVDIAAQIQLLQLPPELSQGRMRLCSMVRRCEKRDAACVLASGEGWQVVQRAGHSPLPACPTVRAVAPLHSCCLASIGRGAPAAVHMLVVAVHARIKLARQLRAVRRISGCPHSTQRHSGSRTGHSSPPHRFGSSLRWAGV